MRARAARALAVLAALGWLVFGPTPGYRGSPGTAATRSAGERLLGPVTALAAGVQWVRFDSALREGRPELAYVHAEAALALRPSSPAGWFALARHLIFDRASRTSEPDPGRRRYWIEAGLETLARGETRATQPGELAFLRGNVLANYVALIPERELDWPGGPRAALEAAIRAFERASELGNARGAEHAALARSELQRIDR